MSVWLNPKTKCKSQNNLFSAGLGNHRQPVHQLIHTDGKNYNSHSVRKNTSKDRPTLTISFDSYFHLHAITIETLFASVHVSKTPKHANTSFAYLLILRTRLYLHV